MRGPLFEGKNWTGGPLFTPDQISRDTMTVKSFSVSVPRVRWSPSSLPDSEDSICESSRVNDQFSDGSNFGRLFQRLLTEGLEIV